MNQAKPIRKKEIRWRTLGEGIVTLYSAEQDDFFELNEIGSLIWENLDGALTLQQLTELITSEYNVEPEQAKADVLEFLTELHNRNMIDQFSKEWGD